MPIVLRKLPKQDLYRVYNKETKEIHSYGTTLDNAKKQVNLLLSKGKGLNNNISINNNMNSWVQYVKNYASKNGMKYNEALKDPKCKAGYKVSSGKGIGNSRVQPEPEPEPENLRLSNLENQLEEVNNEINHFQYLMINPRPNYIQVTDRELRPLRERRERIMNNIRELRRLRARRREVDAAAVGEEYKEGEGLIKNLQKKTYISL